MAQKIVLVDDLDGSAAAESVRFALDGHEYEIDLSAGNASELRTMFAPYQAVARPLRPQNAAPKMKPVTRTNGTPNSSEVRRWAKKRKVKVASTGRLSPKVIEQYLAEQNN